MHEANETLAEVLAVQAEAWFRDIHKSRNVAPRTFTAVSRTGEQFVSIIEEIPWTRPEHIQRRAFLNWLCRKEDVMAYAYAGLRGIDDGSHMINIVADDGENIVEICIPIVARDKGTCVYDESKIFRSQAKGSQWSPYTRLMEPDIIKMDSLDPADEAIFEKWWAALRPKSLWLPASKCATLQSMQPQTFEPSWALINEFDENKVYIDEASVEAEGSLRRVAIRYVVIPYGTDRRNGRAIKEMLMDEEYDLSTSSFRIHSITFTYEDGEVAESMSTVPTWTQASDGHKKHLDYLLLHFSY